MPSSVNARPTTSPYVGHQPRPQQAHLEAEDGARDGADGEEHSGRLRPLLGEHQRFGVVVAETTSMEDVDHRRERDTEAGDDDVEPERQGHLVSGRQELVGSEDCSIGDERGTRHRDHPLSNCGTG